MFTVLEYNMTYLELSENNSEQEWGPSNRLYQGRNYIGAGAYGPMVHGIFKENGEPQFSL
jgi:hypothetical protein